MAEHIPPTDNDAPYLSIQNVVKKFGDHAAVNNVSIDIGKGEIFALLGSSGCGKSTLLRMLAGFELPTSGKILLKGEDISKIPPYERPINMMFQSYALFPHLNVWDNIAFGLRREKIAKAEIPQRVDDVLKLTQLTKFAKRKPHQLSGGQQQRVALARSLVKQPNLLLLDEPLGALDKKLREETQIELVNIIEKVGVTCVMVTHDQEEAMTMADTVAVMNKGRIEQLGAPHEIYQEPATGYVADFIGAANLVPVECTAAGGTVSVQVNGQTVTARAPKATSGSAVLVARPEDIKLAGVDVAGVPARIRSQQYLGVKTTYRVELANGRLLNVDLHGDHRKGFDNGMQVHLAFDPHKTLVLAS